MSKYMSNDWFTTQLTLSVMAIVARHLNLDLHNDTVSEKLYWICCDLEDWPADEGFGSSDHYTYIKRAEEEFTSCSIA